MAYDLTSIKTTAAEHPPRVLIYGPPGLGKTSLAAEFPNPVIMDIEDGVPSGVEIPSLGEITSYQSVLDRFAALYNGDHTFKTLIIDSLDRLEPLIWAHACTENNWASIEDAGYGKGYIVAADLWSKFIASCNLLRTKRGMNIVFIGHSTIDRFDDPQNEPYSRYDIRLHKRANAIIQDECDAIIFVNMDVAVKTEDIGFNKSVSRAEGGSFRWLHCEGRPAFTAKNRFGMPERIKYDKGQGYAQIAPFLPCQDVAKPKTKGAAKAKPETMKEAA